MAEVSRLGRRRSALFGGQILVLVALLVVTGGSTGTAKKSPATKRRSAVTATKPGDAANAPTTTASGDMAIYQGGLKDGWNDFGWSSTREIGPSVATVDFGNWQGWLLDRHSRPIEATSLVLRYRTASDLGSFLLVGLTAVGQQDVGAELNVPVTAMGADGFRSATLAIKDLAPSGRFFQIRLRPSRQLPVGTLVDFASISGQSAQEASAHSTKNVPSKATGTKVAAAGKATITIDCQSPKRKPIDPRIYGIGFSEAGYLTADTSQLGATINRWGGNPTSRYNWKLGNAWNTALDYYWRNVTIADGTSNALEKFFAKNQAAGRLNAVTVPMLGWVAKDESSYTFPVAKFGAQQSTDPQNADIGNGRSTDGKKLAPPDPKSTSVATTPEDVGQWVGSSLKGRTNMYFLDNEVELWNDTHRDVHPQATTYDEVLDLGIRYATAIKKADPQAVVAGPASWGWPAYFYSAADAEAGFGSAPDRKAHGDVPLLAWYLRKMKEQETKTGQRLLDVLDVHFYPQQSNVYGGGVGGSDAATNKLRLRSTRGLWDASYSDESWIGEPVNLLPRMKKLIDENYPGTGLSIGEWSFGGEGTKSGGLATAMALGTFGSEGVTAAFYWTAPPANSPTFWAFRAFRNFDGQGGQFLDTSIEATSSSGTVSAFASTDSADSSMVAVLVNTDPSKALEAPIVTRNCKSMNSVESFTYDAAASGFGPPSNVSLSTGGIGLVLPKYSITVVRAKLG